MDGNFKNENNEHPSLKKTQFNRILKNVNKRIKKIGKLIKKDSSFIKKYKKKIQKFNSQRKVLLEKLLRQLH